MFSNLCQECATELFNKAFVSSYVVAAYCLGLNKHHLSCYPNSTDSRLGTTETAPLSYQLSAFSDQAAGIYWRLTVDG
jgi:hypothetical protein